MVIFLRGITPVNFSSDLPEVFIHIFEINGPEGIGSMLIWGLDDFHIMTEAIISL